MDSSGFEDEFQNSLNSSDMARQRWWSCGTYTNSSGTMSAIYICFVVTGMILNVTGVAGIFFNHALLKKHFASLALFLYNIVEIVGTLIFYSKPNLSKNFVYPYFIQFFVIGQILSIVSITSTRIRLLSISAQRVNKIIKLPFERNFKRYATVSMTLTFIFSILMAILSILVEARLHVWILLGVISLTLYGWLLAKVFRIRHISKVARHQLQTTTICYVTFIFVLFVLTMIGRTILGVLITKGVEVGCNAVNSSLVWFLLFFNVTHLSTDPVAYFLLHRRIRTIYRSLAIRFTKNLSQCFQPKLCSKVHPGIQFAEEYERDCVIIGNTELVQDSSGKTISKFNRNHQREI